MVGRCDADAGAKGVGGDEMTRQLARLTWCCWRRRELLLLSRSALAVGRLLAHSKEPGAAFLQPREDESDDRLLIDIMMVEE